MVFPSLYLDLPPTWHLQHQIQLNNEQLGLGGDEELSQIPQPLQKNIFSMTEYSGTSMIDRARMARLPPPETGLKCPRCDSINTKFCYFNNYSLLQPRHFCKTCRRYWTHGGALRSVPVGGGCRRNKRNSKRVKSSSHHPPVTMGAPSASPIPCFGDYNNNIGFMEQMQVQRFPFLSPTGVEQNSNLFYGENVGFDGGVNSDYNSCNNMEWVKFSNGLGSSSSSGRDGHFFSRT